MQTDPLQQLRDVHLPVDPSWWPPAIGWWVLAFAFAAVIGWLVRRAWLRHRAAAPLRAARRELSVLIAQQRAGALAPPAFAHECNELLKRLLVRAHRQSGYAKLTGDAWLFALDELSRSTQFTQGPGSVLGNARYAVSFEVNPDGLHDAVDTLLRKLTPPQYSTVHA